MTKKKNGMNQNRMNQKAVIVICIMLMTTVLLTACGRSTEEKQSAESVNTEENTAEEVSTVEEKQDMEGVVTDNTNMAELEETILPAETVPSTLRVYGQVKENADGRIFIENTKQNDMYGQIILNITEDTLILDAVNAEERTAEDIENEETLYAYVSPVMTRSLPPMSNAALIICDIPADFAAPEYADIVSVTTGENGRISLETNRDIIYHISEETEILDFTTGESVEASAIGEGSRVLAWYQIVLESFPAQTYPTKMIVF